MAIFHRNARKKATGNPRTDAVALIIVSRCIRLQMAWASFMGRQAARLSKPTQIAASILFAGTCSCVSIWYAVSSVRQPPTGYAASSQAGLHDRPVPQHKEESAPVIPADLTRVRTYVRYMDSLARSPGGKETFDSIMLQHPGLLDSARSATRIYQSQSK